MFYLFTLMVLQFMKVNMWIVEAIKLVSISHEVEDSKCTHDGLITKQAGV